VAVAPHLITMAEASMDREAVLANSTSLEEAIAVDSVVVKGADQAI
jgi:hypothetical protein